MFFLGSELWEDYWGSGLFRDFPGLTSPKDYLDPNPSAAPRRIAVAGAFKAFVRPVACAEKLEVEGGVGVREIL